jgi:transposase
MVSAELEGAAVKVIGIDSHKATLAGCAVDELGTPVDERTLGNDRAGHVALADWARSLGVDRIGIEGSGRYGAAAARRLAAAGFDVRDVPPHLSYRERLRTHRPGKSDPTDELAIARVAAREQTLPPVRLADRSEDLGLLVTARDELVAEATQLRNRIHADLVVLLPGYGERVPNLVARRHRRGVALELATLSGVRAELTRSRLSRLEETDAATKLLERRLAALLVGHPLLALPGVRVLLAARILAETGDVRRFRSADAFAMFSGTAPIPASSGQTERMRLNRGGDRQLNRALHAMALIQGRYHDRAKAYLARKRAEGKTRREAIRCLARKLARVVFGVLRRSTLATADAFAA